MQKHEWMNPVKLVFFHKNPNTNEGENTSSYAQYFNEMAELYHYVAVYFLGLYKDQVPILPLHCIDFETRTPKELEWFFKPSPLFTLTELKIQINKGINDNGFTHISRIKCQTAHLVSPAELIQYRNN